MNGENEEGAAVDWEPTTSPNITLQPLPTPLIRYIQTYNMIPYTKLLYKSVYFKINFLNNYCLVYDAYKGKACPHLTIDKH